MGERVKERNVGGKRAARASGLAPSRGNLQKRKKGP